MGMYLDRYAGVPLMCQPGIVVDLLDRLSLIRRRDGYLLPVPLEESIGAVKSPTTA